MVPPWSAALSSMGDTILVTVGQHQFLRFLEFMPLHVSLAVHASLSDDWPRLGYMNHISCVHRAAHLISLVLRAGHPVRLACMDRAMHRMLLMVLLRLQAVRKDHSRKTSSDRPSDGLIMISSSL